MAFTHKRTHADILSDIARQVYRDATRQPGHARREYLASLEVTEQFPTDGYSGLIQPMTVPGDYVLPEKFRDR